MPPDAYRINFSEATPEELQQDIDRLCSALGKQGLSLALAVSEAERRRLTGIYAASFQPIEAQISEAAKSRALIGLLAAPALREQPDDSKPVPLSPECLAVINDMCNSVLRAETMLRNLRMILNTRSEVVGREFTKVFPLPSDA